MRFAYVCALTSVVVACSDEPIDPNDVPPDTAQSGSRLKLGWFVFDEGLRTWSGEITDSQLNAPCTPTQWADGTVRCTPELPQVWYTDGACTQPMMTAGEETLAVQAAATCDGIRPERMFERTTGDVRQPMAWRLEDNGLCTGYTGPRGSEIVGTLATQMSRPDLVELTRVLVGEGRLRIETLVGDDGMILPVKPFDTTHDAACEVFDNLNFNANGLADMLSLPCQLADESTEAYVDETCATPAAVVSGAACEAPSIVSTGMGPCRAFYGIGGEPQSSGFIGTFGSCGQGGFPDGSLLYPSTGALEPTRLTRAQESAAARLQLMYIGDGTTRMRERDTYFDAELGLECQLRQRGGDAWLCEPVTPGATAERVFADDQCTQPVYVTWRHDVGNAIWPCVEYKPYTYAFDYENSAVRLIGDQYPDPVYWIFPLDGTCRLMDSLNATAYSLGAPITTALPRATKLFE